ncbi:tetratricopeptide repeat protein [Aurantibacillus circumpalustris]|uniref:tetratricopeptide repeat protein n=1 Tax=Aurantibacillus circumpalustris TaxID=3036359 RepID=UPI00295A845B|nr:tetratricopeptide repeat protein [Aurantibacillus circumpalustris]
MKKNSPFFLKSKTQIFIGLILPAIFLYFKSLSFGFTSMDEQWMIIKDVTFLQDWFSVKSAFTEPSTNLYYRPLFMISLILDYHLAKLNPMMYHLTNLCWHLLSVILLFKFLIGFNVEKKQAYIFSLLFSVNPLLLHAIAWVPGRNDLILCVFTLASLIHIKKFIDNNKRKDLMFHFLFFICALFTKESAIILPLVYIILYFGFKKDSLKRNITFTFIWIAVSAIWLLIRNSITSESITSQNNFLTDFLNFIQGYLIFIGKIIFPIQQSVLPSIVNTSLVPGIATFLIFMILCFYPGLKNKKTAFLGLFIFLMLLAIPVWFGATKPGSEHYEQRIYGSMIGIILFLSQVKFNTDSKLYPICISLFCLIFCLKTHSRMNIYKNELSYIEAGINERPDYYLFHLQKADILNKKREYQASLAYYNAAIDIRPNYPQALSNRGSSYFSLGKFKEATDDYTKAIENSDFNKLYYLNRCQAYFKNNEIENAMHDFGVLKKHSPELIKPDFEKKLTDKWFQLLEGLQKQIQKEPRNAELYFKYSSLYFGVELIPQGIAFLKKAIELDPENKSYQDLLGIYSAR